MKLMTKFNLILLVLFGVGGFLISRAAYGYLMDSAKREVRQEADALMASAGAAREYMSNTLEPLVDQVNVAKEYHPEFVPNISAIAMFTKLAKQHPDYGYKVVALNPRNPENRACGWEADVLTWLRNHPTQDQMEGVRETATGSSLYVAKPIQTDGSCKACHDEAAEAPAAIVAKYGNTNGFGWNLDGDIVAAEIVSVPMSIPVAIANQAYHRLLTYLIVTMVLTVLAIDAGVYWLVIRPLQVVSVTADRVSTGEKNVPFLRVKGNDEIATVTAAFNRMQVSLAKALKLLE